MDNANSNKKTYQREVLRFNKLMLHKFVGNKRGNTFRKSGKDNDLWQFRYNIKNIVEDTSRATENKKQEPTSSSSTGEKKWLRESDIKKKITET